MRGKAPAGKKSVERRCPAPQRAPFKPSNTLAAGDRRASAIAPSDPSASQYFSDQQQMQVDYRCDYVIVVYDKDPDSPPGWMPHYIAKNVQAVKLNHQIFMQIMLMLLH